MSRAGSRIRIVIVDDHQVVRHGLRHLLERESDMEVVGEAGSGTDAVRVATEQRPDVVLLDVKLDDLDGPEVCRRITAAVPGTAVVMLTSYLQDAVILRSLAAGAKGYLIKDVELHEVKRTIRAVHRGHSVLDPKVASRVIARAMAPVSKASSSKAVSQVALSETDLAILRHLAKGMTNKQIGAQVHLSAYTIKDHLEKIGTALAVRSRTEIVAEALRAGLI
jgi:two-component system, NarL family, response regulator DevR